MSSIAIAFAIRLLLVLLFIFSAFDKIFNHRGAIAQASEAVSSRQAASVLILIGFIVEVAMSAGLLTGIADRAAAFILAGYCGATALLWKQFWKPGDFWKEGASRARSLFWDFLKNFALAGGSAANHFRYGRVIRGRVFFSTALVVASLRRRHEYVVTCFEFRRTPPAAPPAETLVRGRRKATRAKSQKREMELCAGGRGTRVSQLPPSSGLPSLPARS